MKELSQRIATEEEKATERIVAVIIDSKEYELSGHWQWDLRAEAVYCSDVFFSLPLSLEGTKALIHPDDKMLVQDRLAAPGAVLSFLQFRIITTYGEVKVLTGRSLHLSEVDPVIVHQELAVPAKTEYELSKQVQRMQWQARAGAYTERIAQTGYWYLNTATSEMFYSDGVYRLHNLPPQSLNAHLHTFFPFVHPEERGLLEEALTKAIYQRLPLHVEYRIQLPNEVEKKLRQTLHWEFNDKGAFMLYATVADVTEHTAMEQKAETAEYDLALRNRLLQMNEQISATGHWYINLLTRKVVYSDNMYRLHGLKPKSVPPGLNIFLNYIHPEDREVVKEITHKIIRNHEPPDIDFRVVRQDGTVRNMRQRGKMAVYGDGEMVMIVSLQDVTKEKAVERKSAEWAETLLVKNFIQNTVEAVAGVGSWVWDVETGSITWSDSMYHLLGYKPGATHLSYKSFLRFIHTDDRKTVADGIDMLLHEKKESQFPFRIIRSGEERLIQASFKLVANSARELFIATLHDVTAGHRLKVEMAKQVHLAEAISRNIRDAVFITDEDNNVLLWNKASEDWFGIKKEEALYQNFFDLLPRLKDEATLAQFNAALKGQPVGLFAVRTAMSKGYHDLLLMPLHNEEGTVTGVLHLLHDVSREQEMQHRLTERLNFIERLLEASVDRIIVLDRHMNYLYCNQKAADAFGVSKEELLGKNVLEIFPSSVSNPSYEYFRRALQGETVHIPAIDGLLEEHYGQVYLIPVRDGEVVSAVLWIWQDLGGEIKLQRQLRKSDDILNTIEAAVVELDGGFHFRYINPTGEFFFGRPKEALLGKLFWEAFPQTEGTPEYLSITRAVHENRKTETECFSAFFNRWVLISATPSPEGVIVMIYDRHDIKETQQKLKEEHRRMLDAQAIGKTGSFEWNVGEATVAWSDEMYRINGLEPQSRVISVDQTEAMIHPEDLPPVLELKRNSFKQPGLYEIAHRILLPGGTVKWVNHRFESMAGEAGGVTRVHGTLQDITGQKKTEEELLRLKDEVAQKAADKYLALFNSIDEGFYRCEVIFDEADNPVDVLYLEENPAAVRIVGMSIVGKTLRQVSPVPEGHWFRIWGDVALTGESRRMEQYAEAEKKWFDFYVAKVGDGAGREVVVVFQDVTERKNAEEQIANFTSRLEKQVAERTKELQLAHNRIATIFGAVPLQLGYYHAVRNAAGEIEDLRSVLVNEASVERMSMAGGAGGQLMSEQVPGLKERPVWQTIKDVIQTRQPQRTELYYDFGSSARWFDVLYTPLEDGLISASLDITDRKKAEAEITKNLTILRQAEDIAAIGSWEYQIPSGRFSWSDGMYRIFDYPRGAPVQPEAYLQSAVEEDRPVAKRIVKNLRSGCKTFEETLRIKSAGTERTLKVKGGVVNDEAGKPQKMIGVDVDITDITKAEKDLAQSRHWLMQTAEASPDAITIYDLKKKEPVYLNNCLAEWTGTGSEELVKMGVEGRLKMVHPDDRLPLLQFNERLSTAGDGQLMTIEYRLQKADGGTIWLRNRSKVFLRDKEGRVTHMLSILQEVTEEKKRESILRHLNANLEQKAVELEAKNEEITNFAFIASHDLKEPIRKIHTFSNWLMEKEADGLSIKGKEYAYKISNAVKRLDGLIEDITILTKLQAIKALPAAVDLNDVLAEVQTELKEAIEQSGAVVESRTLPAITGDKKQLVHLFRNLVDNAVKFQQPDVMPVLEITCGKVSGVKGLPAGDYYELKFTDNGIGFEAQYAEKIFRVFQRLHGQAAYPGSGIGLAICKKIMENHGGDIKAQSTPGRGSVFTCWFPALS